jgi:short-subunit dehydrogenase
MKKHVVILGANGGIGSEIVKSFSDYNITKITKKEIDLSINSPVSIIKKLNPDVIINAAGMFGKNYVDYDKLFNVNVKSNWDIIKYYMDNPSNKIVKIMMIGSSAYTQGRKDYILYAASKSALHNMFEGSSELLAKSNIILGLIHPTRVDTKMLDGVVNDRSSCLSPKYIAEQIKIFTETIKKSEYINLN